MGRGTISNVPSVHETKNVILEYLEANAKRKKATAAIPKPEGLDWAYVFSNKDLPTKNY